MVYTVVLTPEVEPGFEGWYSVEVPALPGCVTQGKGAEQAIERAKEAIACHIAGLRLKVNQCPSRRRIH